MAAVPEHSRALAQALEGHALLKTSATPAAAFARAQEIFRAGERLDMGRLAEDLGISRATLYRWTGDRDQLLADVIWAEARRTLQVLEARAPGAPTARIEHVAAGFVNLLARSEPLRRFLRHEHTNGLLLLTAPNGPFRPRLLSLITEMLNRVVELGYRPPESLDLLADSIISLGERFLHNGGDPQANPSPEMAKRAIALLVRER